MTATLIGATGLIGSYLLEELLHDPSFDTVKILIRRPIDISDAKLEKKIVDFNDNDSLLIAMANSDVVFCSIGTTNWKTKGDKEAYRRIDYDIPVKAARFCKITGCEKFVLVSSVGANTKARGFYLKLKGEIEEAIQTVGLNSVHVMRPSMLLGNRKEFRFGEKVGAPLIKAFSFLLSSKYKPIQARDVARAMVAAAKKNDEGFFVHEYKDIKQMSG